MFRNYSQTNKKNHSSFPHLCRYDYCNSFENLAAKSMDSRAACLGTNVGLLSVGPG